MSSRINQLKTSIEKLRKDSVDVVANANRIVSQGVQRLAEHELKALNDTYKSVLDSVKSAKKGDSLKDTANKQIDLMQDTVNRLIASARESISIVSETREELSGLLNKGLHSGAVAEAEIHKLANQAKKAVADVKSVASEAQKKAVAVTAQARASADKVAAAVKKDAQKVVTTVKKDATAMKRQLGSVLDVKPKIVATKKAVIAAKPSPNSRASRATSKAKEAVSKAKGAASSVVDAVKNAG